MRFLKYLVISFLLSGCSPFVEYEHLSDPRIANDGYDLLCAGGETSLVSVSVCQNVAPHGGQFVKVNARYVWNEK